MTGGDPSGALAEDCAIDQARELMRTTQPTESILAYAASNIQVVERLRSILL
jgi:hypothetical protein